MEEGNRAPPLQFESQNQSFTQTVPPPDVAAYPPKHTYNAPHQREGTLFGRFDIEAELLIHWQHNVVDNHYVRVALYYVRLLELKT